MGCAGCRGGCKKDEEKKNHECDRDDECCGGQGRCDKGDECCRNGHETETEPDEDNE